MLQFSYSKTKATEWYENLTFYAGVENMFNYRQKQQSLYTTTNGRWNGGQQFAPLAPTRIFLGISFKFEKLRTE